MPLTGSQLAWVEPLDRTWVTKTRLSNLNARLVLCCACYRVVGQSLRSRTQRLHKNCLLKIPIFHQGMIGYKSWKEATIFTKWANEWQTEEGRHLLFHSFIRCISIEPLQVVYHSEVLQAQHGYCAGISRRSTTGNCEWRTCPRSLRGS